MDWNTIASVATAIGVGIGVWQIREGRKLAQSSFEDSLDQQYRHLARDIPVDALIGKPVLQEKQDVTRELIYNYLDLCNEQVFLRAKKRVSRDTWRDWCAGIKSNLSKPAFKVVWDEVKDQSPASFTLLEKLEEQQYAKDPAHWTIVQVTQHED